MSDPFRVDHKTREAVFRAVMRWADECEAEANRAWENGRGGYLGRLKVCAFVDDDSITLRVDRSFTEDL